MCLVLLIKKDYCASILFLGMENLFVVDWIWVDLDTLYKYEEGSPLHIQNLPLFLFFFNLIQNLPGNLSPRSHSEAHNQHTRHFFSLPQRKSNIYIYI